MASKINITRDDYRVFYPVTTRWMDNDVYGHVNNVTYYSYFDTAVNTFLINECGLDVKEGSVIGLVVSSGCEYLQSIAYPDQLTVGVRVNRLGRSSVQYGVGVFKSREQHVCAFGHFTHVFVDRATKHPQPLPEDMRKSLQKILYIS